MSHYEHCPHYWGRRVRDDRPQPNFTIKPRTRTGKLMRETTSGFRFTAWRHAVELAEMPGGQWFWHVRDHAYAHRGEGTGYAETMAEAEKAGDRSAEMSLERKEQWSE